MPSPKAKRRKSLKPEGKPVKPVSLKVEKTKRKPKVTNFAS